MQGNVSEVSEVGVVRVERGKGGECCFTHGQSKAKQHKQRKLHLQNTVRSCTLIPPTHYNYVSLWKNT